MYKLLLLAAAGLTTTALLAQTSPSRPTTNDAAPRPSASVRGSLQESVRGAGTTFAQFNPGNGGFRNRGGATADDGTPLIYLNGDPYGIEPDGRRFSWPRRPIDLSDRQGIPSWPIDTHFKGDLFTFVRINWNSTDYSDAWQTDYPSSDLNLSFRLPELTTIRTNPNPIWLKFTDPRLLNYPFCYMVEVSTLKFTDEEVPALQHYLKNGGFLMVDDFWGEEAWTHFHKEMRRVFPDREPVDLDISHPIFHCVFDLKEKPQIPGIEFWANGHQDDGRTWEKPEPDGSRAFPHYYAYFDDKGRMVCLICHNTDLGDGWSRELSTAKLLQNISLKRGIETDPTTNRYFHEFCEKYGYPMGVNIVFYVMTH